MDWGSRGLTSVRCGRYDEAADCFARAVEADPAYADGWHNLGTSLRRLGRPEEAFLALKRALEIAPDRADTFVNLGNLLIDNEQFDDALECYERAARIDPAMARARSRLAAQRSARGQLPQAEHLFRQSLALDAGHIEGWLGLGQTLEDLGDAEGAQGCYRNVLQRSPGHAGALGSYLALLRDEAPAALLRATARRLADPALAPEACALIAYGLSKYHDRRGDWAAAAAAGRTANAARRQLAGPLDRAALEMRVDALISHYTPDFFAGRRNFGAGTDQPVFIIGLPRSGTTLVEQMIAAHPLLHGAGELPDLARLATRLCDAHSVLPWQSALRLDEPGSRQLAWEYLRALRDGAPKGRLRIVDKAPFNFFQLAFAALLFPQARVIHCRRDARDNALSIWMENFNAEQRYATDFEDLAVLRAQYGRVMSHWSQVLPLSILTVDYEQLVSDFDGEARRIITFLGAPWDRRCLDFHRSARAVQTPSRWQVRQPVYSRSVGRWQSYAGHLPELAAAFDAGATGCGA